MAQDYEQYLHKEWLGLLQPEGLVVSPPALSDLQAFVDREKALELQPILQGLIQQGMLLGKEQTWVPDFEEFARQVLEWDGLDFVAQGELPEDLAVSLMDYGETLVPDYGVKDPDSEGWLALVQVVSLGHDLDKDDPEASEQQGWKATYQQKFERLLKGTQVPIGLLWNGVQVRLVYAPSGESSGHLTFPIAAMTEVPGRLVLGALEMLLGGDRLFNSPTDKTLLKLLETSRSCFDEACGAGVGCAVGVVAGVSGGGYAEGWPVGSAGGDVAGVGGGAAAACIWGIADDVDAVGVFAVCRGSGVDAG
jgi:hypothetical protein